MEIGARQTPPALPRGSRQNPAFASIFYPRMALRGVVCRSQQALTTVHGTPGVEVEERLVRFAGTFGFAQFSSGESISSKLTSSQ